jgi:hypothetical protein
MPGSTLRSVAGLAAWLALAATACGGSEPPPREPEAPHEQATKPAHPAIQMRSELGSVDPDAVKKAFHALENQFMDCQKQGLDRVEVLAGSVKFFVRIAENGAAKWVYLEDTDLGDRATEKCLIDAAMGAHWPKPDGGEAEARYGMELPLQATRPPNDWDSDKVSQALAKHGGAIDHCKGGGGGQFHATMYVGAGGRVLSAGVATSGKDDDEKADCLANVLTKMKGLPSPGSWPAKVSFAL